MICCCFLFLFESLFLIHESFFSGVCFYSHQLIHDVTVSERQESTKPKLRHNAMSKKSIAFGTSYVNRMLAASQCVNIPVDIQLKYGIL